MGPAPKFDRVKFLELAKRGLTGREIEIEMGMSQGHSTRLAQILGVTLKKWWDGKYEQQPPADLVARYAGQAAHFLPVANGRFAVVDASDKEFVGSRWCLNAGGYAYRHAVGKKPILLHQLILGVAPGGQFVDHINGDRLDNRRCNLRFVDIYQSNRNRGPQRGRKLKGFVVVNGRFLARIRVDGGKVLHIGSYSSEIEAARAYDAAARRHHGEFARLNFADDAGSLP